MTTPEYSARRRALSGRSSDRSAQQSARDLGVAVIRRRRDAKNLSEDVIDVHVLEWRHVTPVLNAGPAATNIARIDMCVGIVPVLAGRPANASRPQSIDGASPEHLPALICDAHDRRNSRVVLVVPPCGVVSRRYTFKRGCAFSSARKTDSSLPGFGYDRERRIDVDYLAVVRREVVVHDDDTVAADRRHAVIGHDNHVDPVRQTAPFEPSQQSSKITVRTHDRLRAPPGESGPCSWPAWSVSSKYTVMNRGRSASGRSSHSSTRSMRPLAG